MRIHKIRIITIAALGLALACNTRVEHKHEQPYKFDITLDNGKPWIANPETTAGIQAMSSIVSNLPASPDPDACRNARISLTAAFDGIIQQCTMTGEAHDQLHHYLMPMADVIRQLDVGNAEDCAAHISTLQKMLGEYNTYFKS